VLARRASSQPNIMTRHSALRQQVNLVAVALELQRLETKSATRASLDAIPGRTAATGPIHRQA